MRYLIFSLLLLGCMGCEKAPPPEPVRPVRALELQQEERVSLVAFPGRTQAVERVTLSFRVDGQLIERPVFVGDEVLKGELLAHLDPRDYEARLQNAIGQLERAQAELRFAEKDYERAIKIWTEDPGAISQSLLDQKEEEVNRLKGQLKSFQAQVESASDQVEYTYLRSPFDGVVVATYVDNYEYVKSKQSVIRLLNTSQIEMMIDVPEKMIAEIPYVDRIVIEFDAIPGKEFLAEVKEIGTEASTTTRTYPVTLLLKGIQQGEIYAGMAGYAYLYSDLSKEFDEEGYILPTSALLTDDSLDQTFVWIVDPETMTVNKRAVKKGKLTSRGIIVTEGLEEGEWVVTAGVHYLYEGKEVKLQPVVLNSSGEQVEVYPGEEDEI